MALAGSPDAPILRGVKYKALKRVVWRRTLADGKTPAKATRTALRPDEEDNVRAAVRLLYQ